MGLAYYTLGQRQGLGLGGTRGGPEAPWFVAAKDLARNALVVVQGHDHPMLHATRIDAIEPHWIAGDAAARCRRGCAAKTRYRMADAACEIVPTATGLRATFDAPQFAPTPGQYLVLYDGDVCLGGAVIASSGAAAPDASLGRASMHAVVAAP